MAKKKSEEKQGKRPASELDWKRPASELDWTRPMTPSEALDQGERLFDAAVDRSVAHINRSLAQSLETLQRGASIEVGEEVVLTQAACLGDARSLLFNRSDYRQALVDLFAASGWSVSLINKGPGMAFVFTPKGD